MNSNNLLKDFSCYSSSLPEEHFKKHEPIPMIDCTYYQTVGSYQALSSCYSSPYQPILNNEIYSKNSMSSSEPAFQQMRNYLNNIRCKMLTRLVQRNITGLELIRAFEEAPKVIEKMHTSNSNACNDKFIDQLVNITHDIIIESPYKCPPKSSPPVSDITIDHEFQFSPIPSVSKIKSYSPSPSLQSFSPAPVKSNTSPPSSLKNSPPLSPQSSSPKLLSPSPSEDQPLSMGYQWKGEDN